ncbi:hypothetical protein [Yoonia sp. SDW83-1]|uniref:hypothetical protein n=1 Tax=Yoonia sp. SDW83-1 TaxID=3366945 RepID=UPI00398C6B2E
MQFAPEAQILILNGVILAVAYLGIYPSLEEKTLNRIMTIDVVLSALALTVAGALFWGTGTRFNMLFFHSNWAIFTIITLFVMEVPIFLNFARKHGINLFDDPD